MNLQAIHAIRAFARTRRLQRKLRTRDDIAAWRAQRLRRFLDQVAPRVPFYHGTRGGALSDLPMIDRKSVV